MLMGRLTICLQVISSPGLVLFVVIFCFAEMIDGIGYGYATDIWSLGIVALTLSEGNPPYYREVNPRKVITLISELPAPRLEGAGSMSTIGNVASTTCVNESPSRVRKQVEPWSAELLDFIGKCLVKDPRGRADLQNLLAHSLVNDVISELSSSPSSTVLRDLAVLREGWAIAALDRHRRQKEAEEREAQAIQREREEEAIRARIVEKRRVQRVLHQEMSKRLIVLEELAKKEAEQEAMESAAMDSAEVDMRTFLKLEQEERLRQEKLAESMAEQQMYVEDEIAYLERLRLASEDLYYAEWICKQSEYMGLWNPRFFTIKEGVIRYYDSGEEDVAKTERGTYIMSSNTSIEVLSRDSPLCLHVKDEKENGDSWDFVIRCADARGLNKWKGYLERNRLFIEQRLSLTPFQVGRSAAYYKEGWLEKESEYFGSWNKRFFVIDKGVITYFDSDDVPRPPHRGIYVLSFGSDLLCDSSEEVTIAPLEIYIHDANAYTGANWTLKIRCVDENEKQQWVRCIELHMSLFLQIS